MTYGFSVRCVFHCHRWLRHLCFRFVFVLLQLEQRVKAETEEEQEEAKEEETAAPAATPPVYSETNED